MLTLTHTVHFAAAHRLSSAALSPEENQRVFGKCALPGGHGHNYALGVTVTGPVDQTSGMIVNVTRLHEVVQREVLDCMDHRDLNEDVHFLRGVVTTMEHLVTAIAERLQDPLTRLGVRLVRLTLAESDKNLVTLDLHEHD